MLTFPNAKINLGLNIVSKRPDGYHNLETIFYPIKICDALEIIYNTSYPNNTSDSLVVDGLNIDSDIQSNLVLKAVRLLRSKGFSFPYLNIQLLKKIPMGAGIGGGSSDATSTLLMINELFDLNIGKIDLQLFASQLGADCAFFVYNTPQYAQGIGDILEPITIDLNNYYIYVVKPDVFVSTKDAFANIIPKPSQISLKDIVQLPVSEWKQLLINDFEKSVFSKYPSIEKIKNKLYDLGADYASMTGSGASVFAISKEPLNDIEKVFENCYLWNNKNNF